MESLSLQLEQPNFVTRAFEWAHEHTKAIEVVRYALDGVGATFILIGALSITADVVLIIATGALIIVAVETTMLALDILGVISVDAKEHAFQSSSINDSSLYYNNDLPILKIRAETHSQAGYDHGYLLAHQLVSVQRRMKLLFWIGYLRIDGKLYERLEVLKKSIPHEYMEEMEGIIKGANDRLKEDSWWPSTYSLDDIVMLHLLPDLMHLVIPPPRAAMACTAIMGKDYEMGDLGVGRNLDWPGVGAGRYTILLDLKIGNGKQLLLPTIPGTVGVITGLSKTLFVSINVTEPKKKITHVNDGVLSLFLNRQVLEQCETVGEGGRFSESAAVPYHMFVAGRKEGVIYHFGQGYAGETISRPLVLTQQPHFVLNCCHNTAEPLRQPNTVYYGQERFNNIHTIWSRSSHLLLQDRIRMILCAPGVNNPMTVHSILWIQDRLEISFNNSFAATSPTHIVRLDQQFE